VSAAKAGGTSAVERYSAPASVAKAMERLPRADAAEIVILFNSLEQTRSRKINNL
jgi:hypothetical protein